MLDIVSVPGVRRANPATLVRIRMFHDSSLSANKKSAREPLVVVNGRVAPLFVDEWHRPDLQGKSFLGRDLEEWMHRV